MKHQPCQDNEQIDSNGDILSYDRLRRCRWCAKGMQPMILDADGTRSIITGKPGVWSHAHEDYWWGCAATEPLLNAAPLPPVQDERQGERNELPITPTQLAEWRAVVEKATPGPYFVAHDTARDCGPHADSGLALIDTGRHGDWPVARLCEWPTARAIAVALENFVRLIDEVEAGRQAVVIERRELTAHMATLIEENESLRSQLREAQGEVERLRKLDAQSRESGCWCDEHGHPCKACENKQTLAAELTALRDENDRLRGINPDIDTQEVWQKELPYLFRSWLALYVENQRLRDENERLRTILRGNGRTIREWQKQAERIGKLLKCSSIDIEEGIAALRAENEWRSIDSAPKDGTEILALDKDGNIGNVVYSSRKDIWVSPDGGYAYDPIGWLPRTTLPLTTTTTKTEIKP